MTQSFNDPEGHLRPYCTSRLWYGALVWPDTRKAIRRGLVSIGSFCALSALLLYMSQAGWFLTIFVFTPLVVAVSLVPITDWQRRRRDPEGSRLAGTHTGRELLAQGEALRGRRSALRDKDIFDHPVLSLIPQEERAGLLDGAWQEQLRLERELRAEQEASLRILTAVDSLIG